MEEEKFDSISDERKKRIIKFLTMAMLQQRDKSEEKLRENKERVKSFIHESEVKRIEKEVDFAEFIGSYLIANREAYADLPSSVREDKLLEEMVRSGIIQTTSAEPARTSIPQAVDLSSLNRPDLLCTNKTTGRKEIKYGRYSADRRQPYSVNYQGKDIQLTRVGRLNYKTSLMVGADIDEYLVQSKDGEAQVFTYGLDLSKIEKDEQYRKLFFEQLISDENMKLPNGNGYIGSIVNTGDEQNKYKIEYSEEEYTAVTELKQRLEEMKQKQRDEDKDDR